MIQLILDYAKVGLLFFTISCIGYFCLFIYQLSTGNLNAPEKEEDNELLNDIHRN